MSTQTPKHVYTSVDPPPLFLSNCIVSLGPAMTTASGRPDTRLAVRSSTLYPESGTTAPYGHGQPGPHLGGEV